MRHMCLFFLKGLWVFGAKLQAINFSLIVTTTIRLDSRLGLAHRGRLKVWLPRLHFCPQRKSIIHGASEILLAAKIALRGLNRSMAEQELNLLNFHERPRQRLSVSIGDCSRRRFDSGSGSRIAIE